MKKKKRRKDIILVKELIQILSKLNPDKAIGISADGLEMDINVVIECQDRYLIT